MKGNSPADGFQTSWNVSAASDRHITAIATAVASISTRPPRRRATATAATIASVLTAPIAMATVVGVPNRAGSASSQ